MQLSRLFGRHRTIQETNTSPKRLSGIHYYCSDCGHTLSFITPVDYISRVTYSTPFSISQKLKSCPNCGKKLAYQIRLEDLRIRKIT